MKKHSLSCKSDYQTLWKRSHSGRFRGMIFCRHEFSNDDSETLGGSKCIHIGYICWNFALCLFSYVASDLLPERIHKCTDNICLVFFLQNGCMCWIFVLCVFSDEPMNCICKSTQNCTDYTYWAFHFSVFSNMSSNSMIYRMHFLAFCQFVF